ncbi:scavenger receptor cysteine-rich domain-containing protein DMBT1-like [Diadema antillarum]|uniref:scavenger receptor cysteine-rich domain-containing protein DMBT1-like n=1 Tax=Diadema antillarum TaxID=105358 RepID=UPI003A87FDA5
MALNDFGKTFISDTYCPPDSVGPTAGPRLGALQRSSTTYSLLTVIFVLSVATCAIVLMRRRKIACCVEMKVRLVGGGDEKEGRVEIECDGISGTVCDYGWSIEGAHVVCRQLGYPRASAHCRRAHFGQGTGPVWLDYGVYCPTGNENSLLECYRLPWGCRRQGDSGCPHSYDVGVRCEGEKNETAIAERYADSRRKLGLAYGFTQSVYYDIRSELVLPSSSVNNGDVLQCHVLGLVRSERLQLSGSGGGSCDGDGVQPNAGILSIETTEIRGEDNVVSLFIVCHVNVTAQPSPPIHTYIISADNVNISSSSSASTLFAPRPNKCIDITCSGTNGHGATSAGLEHCPKDRPAPGIISIYYQTLEWEDQTILNITCHVNPADQPFPPINTFTITADDHVISSDAPSATFELSSATCITVSCMGSNDFGETFRSDDYCPPDSVGPTAGPRLGALQRSSTTYSLLIVIFVLSVATCAIVFMKRRETAACATTEDTINVQIDVLEFTDLDKLKYCAFTISTRELRVTMVVDCRLLLFVSILPIVIQHIDGIQMTLNVSNPIPANQEVTAVCSAEEVYGSYELAWYLNGVQITDGVTTTPMVNRVDKLGIGIRLVGGSDEKEGRVEIQCDGIWGTVCGYYGWEIEQAHVVCRQLGYSTASARFLRAHFGEGSGPVWLHRVYCPTGNENSLLECFRYPWGCNIQSGMRECPHSKDVGVRCEGEKNETIISERYAEGQRRFGLAYGFTESVYYDIWSNLTLTSSSVNNGDVLQCHVLGFVRSARLQLSAGLQSSPLHAYTIAVDNVNISSSSSASTLFAPRPKKCIDVTCSGTNGHDATWARVEHCPKDRPAPGIISIDYQTLEWEDRTILNITCHVNPADQPFPPIHTFTITADDDLISSDAPSATFEPSPTTCIDVSCMALNDYGETFKRDTYCPPDSATEQFPKGKPHTICPKQFVRRPVLVEAHCSSHRPRSCSSSCSSSESSSKHSTRRQKIDYQIRIGTVFYEQIDQVYGDISTRELRVTMVVDGRLLLLVSILPIVIQHTDGIQMTLDVPSPLPANQEVTAVCSAEEVYGSYELAWYLNGVQISDGVTTTATVNRVGKIAIGMRLVGGADEKEGRVEIECDGIWGTVYDSYWSIEEAHVVCKQLGYQRASAHYINAHFGQGSGPIWQTWGFNCPTGNENSLLECYRLPWGCNCQGCSTHYHSDDAGVRCEGEKNVTAIAERYAESRRKLGLAYGFTESVYYDLRSNLTFSSSSVKNGDVLQCHVLGFVQTARLEVSGSGGGSCDGDGAQPNAGILSIETTEIRGEDNVVSLFIVCHVNVTAQPSPSIHTYTISADNINISSSSSASTLFAPRPNKCIDITCSGSNGHGATSARLEHCPKVGPTAGPRLGALQRSSTTYSLLIVIFVLSVATCAIVLMKRRETATY